MSHEDMLAASHTRPAEQPSNLLDQFSLVMPIAFLDLLPAAGVTISDARAFDRALVLTVAAHNAIVEAALPREVGTRVCRMSR